ncbi:ATP-binding protein [Micromonospora sp. NPDC050795]|uniref:ATP-binding protein n=1 Tax=Micromonospora sp. NPDC050795 TaxID=3364282 RepID=UPI00379BBA3A
MTSFHVSRPPPGAAELQRWPLTGGNELRSLRISLNRCLADLTPLPTDLREDFGGRLLLVATELATNALQHGTPPAIIRLSSQDEYLILDVSDSDLTSRPHLTDPVVAGCRGRGLMISQSLSSRIGWYQTPTAKHTWAAFLYPS